MTERETAGRDDARLRRRLALAMAILVLLLNEWTLGRLFAVDGTIDGPKLWLVRLFDLGLLGLAPLVSLFGIAWGRLYRDFAVVFLNTLVLAVAVNVLAYAGLSHWGLDYFYSATEFLRRSPDLARQIYGIESLDAIRERIFSPGAAGHPSLPMMMRPTKGSAYNSGPRGERISCRGGVPVDTALDGAIWMFGGSTTYGTGVADCETLASALMDQDPANTYVNLGVEAFGRNPEVERLLLLLREGHRPKAVIFLDGLNDIDINIQRAPLLPVTTVGPTLEHSYYHAILNDNGVFLSNLIGRLPLVALLGGGKGKPEPCRVDTGEAGLNLPGSEYHDAPLGHFGRQVAAAKLVRDMPGDALPTEVMDSCSRRIRQLYRGDQDFLDRLSRAFGFKVVVFFQPLVMLAPGNPFVRHPDRFAKSGYRAFNQAMVDTVRADIAAGRLPGFADLSRMGMDCRLCFVDPNHYSPAFNRDLAAAMAAELRRRSVVGGDG